MKPADSETKLLRAIGLKEIIALTINGIIGAGIFALPATVAKTLGLSSPIAFLIAGFFAAILVLCFAELGGKYERTGGAYLYACEAFGGITAFLIGWMYFLARVTSVAALSNAMVGFLGYFFSVESPIRESLILTLLFLLGLSNYIGIRFSSRLINFLTLAKLIPLLIFVSAGLLFVNWDVFKSVELPHWKPLSGALLVTIFAFSGFEIIAVPAAEIKNPRKNLPLGILVGTGITLVLYLLIQTVAVATYPGIASSKSPLADAAGTFLGPRGGMLLSAGAVCSTIGTLTSLILVAPRILFAMSLNWQMPALFAKVHSKFRTPHVSIFLFTVATTTIALSGTFERLATLSAMARLMTYIGSAVALLILRRKNPSPETFRAPGGWLCPIASIFLSLFLLTAATKENWIAGLIALATGILLYAMSSGTAKAPR